jgi:RHS repeat-associated protein
LQAAPHKRSRSFFIKQLTSKKSAENAHSTQAFGTTSYQATNSSITAAAKRYRYTGMERDEETGLNYHNARYYIPWLGRWLNCDPIGIGDGVNVYAYCHNDPIKNSDKQGTQTTTEDGVIDKAKEVVNEVGKKVDDIKKEAKALEQKAEKALEGFTIESMMDYANELLPGVSKLTEKQKQEIFKNDTKGTIGILLYEFATGTGPSKDEGLREFGKDSAISKDIAKMDITQNAVDGFYEKNAGASPDSKLESKHYHSMSPNSKLSQGFNLATATKEHAKIAIDKAQGATPLRVFLGSMGYNIKSDGKNLNITVTDSKSRNSLFLHGDKVMDIAKNVNRDGTKSANPSLSSTTQKYKFSIPLEKERLQTITQKVQQFISTWSKKFSF